MAFKKWRVTYTNPVTGERPQSLELQGPQQTEDAVKAHVEQHVLMKDAGGQVHASTYLSAEAVE